MIDTLGSLVMLQATKSAIRASTFGDSGEVFEFECFGTSNLTF